MIHVGDVGTRLQLQFMDYEYADGEKTEIGPLDISGGDVEEIIFLFEKPDGSAVMKSFSGEEVERFQGSEDSAPGQSGIAYYDVEPDFIDQPGTWALQGVIEFADGKIYHAKTVGFLVRNP